MPNLTNALEPIDLMTEAEIAILENASDGGTTSSDVVAAVMVEVSSMIGEYLGMHLLRAARTEVYELRRGSRFLSLDALDVDITTSAPVVRVGCSYSEAISAAALTPGDDYSVNPRQGTIRFACAYPNEPTYVSVTYTGGLFATAAEIGTKHLWLTTAAKMQVQHRLARQDTLGGNLTTLGGEGTAFEGSYNLLPPVKDMLRKHRRVHV